MLKKRNSILVALLLLSWFAAQANALHHEYSAEHLLSTGNHVCFAQAAQLDDVFHTDPCGKILLLALDSISVEQEFGHLFVVERYQPQCPRAPPIIS